MLGCNWTQLEQCRAEVQPARAERYDGAVEELLRQAMAEGVVKRRTLASVVGKLQFVADVAPGMRQLLQPLYAALGSFAQLPEEGCEWEDYVEVRVGEAARLALGGAQRLLRSEEDLRRRWYPDQNQELAGFWEGQCVDSHQYMDEHSYTSNGVPVITGDASDTQGAAHHKGDMLIWEYPQELCAPVQSSNYRELDTVVRPLEAWGIKFAGGRVLARSDNSTAVAVVNRRGTTSSNLQELGHELVAVCKRHDIDLAAIHIPGVQNGLADRGSRFKRVLDHGDWMLSKRAFQHVVDEVRERFGVQLTLDGGADPVGSNRQLPRYCSVVNSIFDHDLRGEHLYVNPDFDIIKEVLEWFLECYRDVGQGTSGTFVVPVWADRSYWRLLKGAKVLAYYPAGVPLFTSPDWRELELGSGHYGFGGVEPRVHRGDTKWPVLVAHFPPLLVHRCPGAWAENEVGGRREGSKAGSGLPTLQGEAARDLYLLSGLRPCAVY